MRLRVNGAVFEGETLAEVLQQIRQQTWGNESWAQYCDRLAAVAQVPSFRTEQGAINTLIALGWAEILEDGVPCAE